MTLCDIDTGHPTSLQKINWISRSSIKTKLKRSVSKPARTGSEKNPQKKPACLSWKRTNWFHNGFVFPFFIVWEHVLYFNDFESNRTSIRSEFTDFIIIKTHAVIKNFRLLQRDQVDGKIEL